MQRETSPFEKLSETNLYIRGLSADVSDYFQSNLPISKSLVSSNSNFFYVDNRPGLAEDVREVWHNRIDKSNNRQ